MIEDKSKTWTRKQSAELKRVSLRVSMKNFRHFRMFGTELEKKNGVYQDPCAGDSGGPLMYQDNNSGRNLHLRLWILVEKWLKVFVVSMR